MKINPLEYELGFDSRKFDYSAKFRYYEKNNLTYVFSNNGELLLETPYKIIDNNWGCRAFENDVAVVSDSFKPNYTTDKYGLIHISGKVIILVTYKDHGEAFLGNKFISFQNHNKYGYFDTEGNMIFDFIFDCVNLDRDWLSHWHYDLVKIDKCYGVLNYKCEMVIEPLWKEIDIFQFNVNYHASQLVFIKELNEESFMADYVEHHNAIVISFEQERIHDYALLTNHNDEVFIWRNSDKSIKPYTDNELHFSNSDVRF